MAKRKGAPDFNGQVIDELGHFNTEWYRYLTTVYDSDEKTITNGTVTTIPHRQKSPPRKVWCVLKCLAADLGYAVDDEVDAPLFEDTSDYGVGVSRDITNIYLTVCANGIRLPRRTAPIGECQAITNASWALIARFEP